MQQLQSESLPPSLSPQFNDDAEAPADGSNGSGEDKTVETEDNLESLVNKFNALRSESGLSSVPLRPVPLAAPTPPITSPSTRIDAALGNAKQTLLSVKEDVLHRLTNPLPDAKEQLDELLSLTQTISQLLSVIKSAAASCEMASPSTTTTTTHPPPISLAPTHDEFVDFDYAVDLGSSSTPLSHLQRRRKQGISSREIARRMLSAMEGLTIIYSEARFDGK